MASVGDHFTLSAIVSCQDFIQRQKRTSNIRTRHCPSNQKKNANLLKALIYYICMRDREEIMYKRYVNDDDKDGIRLDRYEKSSVEEENGDKKRFYLFNLIKFVCYFFM